MYWGARIAGPVYGGGDAPFDWTSVEKFTAATDKKPSIIHFYAPFANGCGTSGCSFFPFNKSAFQRIRQHGMIPMISWNSASMPLTRVSPTFDQETPCGRVARLLPSKLGEGAKAWGHPYFVLFDREMNGSGFRGLRSEQEHGRGLLAASRLRRNFDDVGARNATWTWCPNVDPNRHFTGYRSLYPGGRFVNWTCLDGYNFANHWRSFSTAYRRSYRVITSRIAPHKPMIIGEVASSEAGGSKASWIKDMLGNQLRGRYPKIKEFFWFNDRDGHERRLADINVGERHERVRQRDRVPSLRVGHVEIRSNLRSGKIRPPRR